MNKEGFLNELREHLRVLDEKEQQDIINEYAQHIDLKMKSGLSEEEAIRDFGNVEELAGDILEAYHVNPQFEEKTKGILIRKPDMEKVSKETRKLAEMIRGFFDKVKEKFRNFKDMAARKWKSVKEEKENQSLDEKYEEKGTKRLWTSKSRKGIRNTGGRWIYNICVLIWNLICIMGTCFLIGTAVLFLFGFGVLLILVFSGYPLLGAEIFCFGVAVAGGSFGLLIFSLRKTYRKRYEEVKHELTGEVD